MGKPSSFSTICTSNCAFELVGLLLSLYLFLIYGSLKRPSRCELIIREHVLSSYVPGTTGQNKNYLRNTSTNQLCWKHSENNIYGKPYQM